MSELQDIWAAHSKEWATLDPVSVRRIIAAKDKKKLDLTETMESEDEAKRVALDVLNDMFRVSRKIPSAWREISESDLTGDDVTDLEEAMFLYALRAIEEGSDAEAVMLWDEREKIWAKHLPSEAMSFLRKAYYAKIRPASLAAFKGDPSAR